MLTQRFQNTWLNENALSRVGELLQRHACQRILLVIDRTAFVQSGAEERLRAPLSQYEITVFDHFTPNPRLEDVEMGLAQFRASRPDACLAIGGGSALDVAKVVRGLGPTDSYARDFQRAPLEMVANRCPLIAVPTTAGTGSEATHFAVVYDADTKLSLAHPCLTPDYSILDPQLTAQLPPLVTVSSGLDALCQACESLWAVGGCNESRAWAKEAAELAIHSLPVVATVPSLPVRERMLWAAHLSGRAIDRSKTTGPHALSYALTTRFAFPHGLAVAILFPAFLEAFKRLCEANCQDPAGVEKVEGRIRSVLEILSANDLDHAIQIWEQLLSDLGVPARLRDIGIGPSDLSELADAVNLERLSNHPQSLGRQELVELLQTIL